MVTVLYETLVLYIYDFVLIDLLGEIKAEILANYLNQSFLILEGRKGEGST